MESKMYAVVQVGGRQYKVSAGDTISADFVDVPVGTTVDFNDVLLAHGDAGLKVGKPFIEGAAVEAQVTKQTRGEKLIIYKRRRRKNSKSLNGFRSRLTEFTITAINA
jgi:large subunit ribosomal protein L21